MVCGFGCQDFTSSSSSKSLLLSLSGAKVPGFASSVGLSGTRHTPAPSRKGWPCAARSRVQGGRREHRRRPPHRGRSPWTRRARPHNDQRDGGGLEPRDQLYRIDVDEEGRRRDDSGRAAPPPQPSAISDTDDQGVSDPRGRAGAAIRGQTGGRSRPASGPGAITNRQRGPHTTPPPRRTRVAGVAAAMNHDG